LIYSILSEMLPSQLSIPAGWQRVPKAKRGAAFLSDDSFWKEFFF